MARTPAQLFSLTFGAVYVVVGLAGFAVTGFDNFASETDDTLIVFAVNPLHNVIHLIIGACWLLGSREHSTAVAANLVVGATYSLVTVLGAVGALEFLSIDDLADPDNFLHLVSAALSLYFGSAGAGEPEEPGTLSPAT